MLEGVRAIEGNKARRVRLRPSPRYHRVCPGRASLSLEKSSTYRATEIARTSISKLVLIRRLRRAIYGCLTYLSCVSTVLPVGASYPGWCTPSHESANRVYARRPLRTRGNGVARLVSTRCCGDRTVVTAS